MNRPVFVTASLEPEGPYAGMIDDWAPRHKDYCERWGYDYLAYKGAEAAGVAGRSPYWCRIDIILRLLRSGKYTHVFWLDADTIIADLDVDLRAALCDWAWLGMTIHPYPAGEDMYHWQSGVMYIRSCGQAVDFFEEVLQLEGKPDSTGFEYLNEQHAMHALFNKRGFHWQVGLVALPFVWNNTLHDQPIAPIVAAFHGNGTPEERRQTMRGWAHHYLRGK